MTAVHDTAIEDILHAGNQAPSGENCQPWHFEVRGPVISVHLLPERDTSAYAWGYRASYLACGAAIENMVIAASTQKYAAQVEYFPDPENPLLVATLTLEKNEQLIADPLALYVRERSTNRKPYEKTALSGAQKEALFSAARREGVGTFCLTEDRGTMARLARVGSTNEEIMLANKQLHDFFFGHINWTLQDDAERTVGFYIETLELPPPARLVFRALRHWSIMRVLRVFGFQRVVAKQNAVTNAAAAAMGGYSLPDVTPLSFVRVGRAIERMWLTATLCGLSLQPLTGVLFFKLLLTHEGSNAFSPQERELIASAYREAAELLQVGSDSLVFMFRVGRSHSPSARASRFPLGVAATLAKT